MSAKPESKLWHLLRDNITDIHWVRIESWSTPGVPDLNGCAEFGEFWVELKIIKNKLEESLTESPLYDIELFTRSIEFSFKEIYKRAKNGLKPENIYVEF